MTNNKLPMTIKAAKAVAGTLGFPSKMPGTSYGISARACLMGSKLAQVEGSVCFGCYALKANYQYPSVQVAHARRLAGITNPAWVAAMVTLLLSTHARGKDRKGKRIAKGFHRWHDSGDLQSIDHLTKICAIAALTPQIDHWLPTRELAMVKAYVAKGGIIPANLTIRVSNTMVDGVTTRAWNVTSGVHNAVTPQGHVCPAPKQEGKCGPCRACWSKDVKHVSYHLH